MILVIEIMMTVSAWKRGWKGWALLPMIIGLFLAFFMGAAMADADEGSIIAMGLMVDIGIMVALGVMIASRPKVGEENDSTNHVVTEEPDAQLSLPFANSKSVA